MADHQKREYRLSPAFSQSGRKAVLHEIELIEQLSVCVRAFDFPVVLLRKLLNSTGAVDELHRARKKRMAARANIHMQFSGRATSLKLGPATAMDRDFFVLGMNSLFHGNAREPNQKNFKMSTDDPDSS